MGKRARRQARAEKLTAPASEHVSPSGDVLVLRGALTPGTRRAYADLALAPAATAEDLWQRRVEFLFERLAVRWVASGVEWEGQKDLLARFRAATRDERAWVRDALRAHIAEHFPDVEAP